MKAGQPAATGKFVYVANATDNTISAYTVNGTTGALTAVTGSPFATLGNPYALTEDASGKHLYVAGNGGIAGYTIDSTSGALTARMLPRWSAGAAVEWGYFSILILA